jgi:hypothetical protein
MRFACVLASVFGLLPLAGPSLALAADPPAVSLEGVDVVATKPVDPKVVSAYPADGAPVAGGLVILRVTFDQAMTADAWAFTRSDEGEFPQCLARPRLLNDKKSFALLCSVKLNTGYAMSINAAPGFVSAAGRAAPPYLLRFKTGPNVTSALHDALTRAGLTDADAPIMDWNGASGISQRAPVDDPNVRTP